MAAISYPKNKLLRRKQRSIENLTTSDYAASGGEFNPENRIKIVCENGENMTGLKDIQKKILDFRNARDWAQFHDPKNLAEALSIEAGELLENFLWKTTEQSRNLSTEELKNVKEELADIFIFLTYLSEEYKIDLLSEVEKKIAVNESKYPVEKAKGSSKKYSDLK